MKQRVSPFPQQNTYNTGNIIGNHDTLLQNAIMSHPNCNISPIYGTDISQCVAAVRREFRLTMDY